LYVDYPKQSRQRLFTKRQFTAMYSSDCIHNRYYLLQSPQRLFTAITLEIVFTQRLFTAVTQETVFTPRLFTTITPDRELPPRLFTAVTRDSIHSETVHYSHPRDYSLRDF